MRRGHRFGWNLNKRKGGGMKQVKMFKSVLTMVAVALVMPFGAFAVTGSGESGTIPLETVSPTLNSVSTVTERSLSATFSEPMLDPGVTTSDNYTASGLGRGSQSFPPAS